MLRFTRNTKSARAPVDGMSWRRLSLGLSQSRTYFLRAGPGGVQAGPEAHGRSGVSGGAEVCHSGLRAVQRLLDQGFGGGDGHEGGGRAALLELGTSGVRQPSLLCRRAGTGSRWPGPALQACPPTAAIWALSM